jgi:hypothetical protein
LDVDDSLETIERADFQESLAARRGRRIWSRSRALRP